MSSSMNFGLCRESSTPYKNNSYLETIIPMLYKNGEKSKVNLQVTFRKIEIGIVQS